MSDVELVMFPRFHPLADSLTPRGSPRKGGAGGENAWLDAPLVRLGRHIAAPSVPIVPIRCRWHKVVFVFVGDLVCFRGDHMPEVSTLVDHSLAGDKRQLSSYPAFQSAPTCPARSLSIPIPYVYDCEVINRITHSLSRVSMTSSHFYWLYPPSPKSWRSCSSR